MRKLAIRAFVTTFGKFGMQRHSLKYVFQHTKFIKLQKGELMSCVEGVDVDKVLFIVKGVLNGFVMDGDDTRIAIWLGYEGSILKPYALMADHRLPLTLEAVEDTTIFLVSESNFEGIANYSLHTEKKILEFIYQKMAVDADQRNILFRLIYHTSRLNYFRKIYPGLEKRLPKILLRNYICPPSIK